MNVLIGFENFGRCFKRIKVLFDIGFDIWYQKQQCSGTSVETKDIEIGIGSKIFWEET